MNASGFSQTCADGEENRAKFPRGRRKGAAQLQRKQTGTNLREHYQSDFPTVNYQDYHNAFCKKTQHVFLTM